MNKLTYKPDFKGYFKMTLLSNNSWIEKKEVFYEEEYFDVPGQWCCECRYWFKEV